MKNIIIDCDNTMGLAGCDIDDGLGIMYLAGHPLVKIVGITTTFGNSTADKVYACTEKLMMDLDLKEIPVIRENRAAAFLAKQAAQQKGELCVLAIGPLTNLAAAYQIDPNFFHNLSEIVLMGGITEPLQVNGRPMKELNFSCDPTAAKTVLTKGENISVMTGNNCVEARIHRNDYRKMVASGRWTEKYLYDSTEYWFSFYRENYGFDGFIAWDVLAASFLMEKDFYQVEQRDIVLSLKNLESGILEMKEPSDATVAFPKIINFEKIKKDISWKWMNIGEEK